jgi:hypothetical protein
MLPASAVADTKVGESIANRLDFGSSPSLRINVHGEPDIMD